MTDAKTRKVELSEARKDLDALIDEASKRGCVVLEKDGAPVAAIISRREYESYLGMAAKRDELYAALDAGQSAFADVPAEEVEREIEKALKKVRREGTPTRGKAKASA